MMRLFLLVSLLSVSGISFAEPINADKPFAEKHVLLQVSDNDPVKFSLTLDIANNLIRHYGSTDNIDIQIVTFAGGIHMLTQTAQHQARIRSLMVSDVSFVACLNTIDSIEKATGVRPVMLEDVTGVQTGVAHMLDEIEKGYAHIHP